MRLRCSTGGTTWSKLYCISIGTPRIYAPECRTHGTPLAGATHYPETDFQALEDPHLQNLAIVRFSAPI